MASVPIELHIKKKWMTPVVRKLDGKDAGEALRLILKENRQSKRTGN